MKNGDLKRLFGESPFESNDFVRLNGSKKVPSELLPSYVDDVIEGYLYNGKFYEEVAHTHEIPAETGKIYVDIPTSISYRYAGTASGYVAIGAKQYIHVVRAKNAAGDVLNVSMILPTTTAFNFDAETADDYFLPKWLIDHNYIVNSASGNYQTLPASGWITVSSAKKGIIGVYGTGSKLMCLMYDGTEVEFVVASGASNFVDHAALL